jgi:hypothetical protein
MENDELAKKTAFLTLRCKELLYEILTYIAVDSPRQAEIMEEQFSKVRRIIYREKENSIEILGIWHTSRGTEFDEE